MFAGDSGGPLYVMDKVGDRHKYVLAGVTSYGYICNEYKVYRKVSYNHAVETHFFSSIEYEFE